MNIVFQRKKNQLDNDIFIMLFLIVSEKNLL